MPVQLQEKSIHKIYYTQIPYTAFPSQIYTHLSSDNYWLVCFLPLNITLSFLEFPFFYHLLDIFFIFNFI